VWDTFYRYFSFPQEVQQIVTDRRIQSTNPASGYATWYTPIRYENPADAKRELALDTAPTNRIGPIPLDEMPYFDIGPRRAAPAHGEPGGGIEARTRSPLWLFGLYSFPTPTMPGRWDL
jgi:hypothetical protein